MRHLILPLALAWATPASTEPLTFPTLTADDLNGRSLTLPAELPADRTIVFVAYKQRQQADIDAWAQALSLSPGKAPAWVELPVVGSGARLIRGFIDNGMRSGITSTAQRAQTVTIYQSAEVVNAPLGFSGTGTIRVLVVRRDGEVLVALSGPVTDEGLAQVRQAMGL
jgi:hypothetical protein